MALPRIAVLDDYQGLSQQMADWAPLAGRAEIVVFRDTLADVDELTKRLDGFSIVCAMRERTKFGRTLLERLPGLELIASTDIQRYQPVRYIQLVKQNGDLAPVRRGPVVKIDHIWDSF